MENVSEIESKGKPAQRYNVELSFEFKKNYARASAKAEVRGIERCRVGGLHVAFPFP